MLDVHPPHSPTHTWKDFFIHVATICVGLLIAVGLEQAVEAIHHAHQRRELLESLLEDTRRAVRDSEEYERVNELRTLWVKQRIAEVRTAISTRRPLPAAALFPSGLPNVPNAPSWTAAKSSGLLAVLSQDEVRCLGEAADLANESLPLASENRTTEGRTQRFEQHFVVAASPERFDFSKATPAELNEYLDLLLAQQTALQRADQWLRLVRGADAAILEGSRNLEQVEASELRFISPTTTK